MNDKRLVEIDTRKEELRSVLNDNTQKVDIAAIEAEINALNNEVEEIRARQEIASKINNDTIISTKICEGDKMDNTNTFETAEYRSAFKNFCATGQMAEEFRATAMTTTNTAVIPTVVQDRIIEALETYGNVYNLVSKTSYAQGQAIPVANMGLTASWQSEGTTAGTKDPAINTQIVFAGYKLQCRVAVSLEMSTMALSAFESALAANVSKAMAKALDQAIVNGSGVGEPEGITKEIVPADRQISVANFDYATICDIEAAIPTAYDNTGVYVMSKNTYMKFEGMVDTSGQPIARVNININNKPERTLFGRTVVLTDTLPSYAVAGSGDVIGFVFDMSNYILNTNMQLTVRKYIDENTDDIVTKATLIADGKCGDTNGLVLLKKA